MEVDTFDVPILKYKWCYRDFSRKLDKGGGGESEFPKIGEGSDI